MTRLITFTDCETTGFLEPEHRIVELTVAMFDFDTEEQKLVKTWRIDPQRTIPAKVVKIHGITNEDVVGKPTFDKVAPKLIDVIKASTYFCAHNGIEFDFPFYKMELRRTGHDMPRYTPFDTWREGRAATAYGKRPSLGELCFALGVDYDTSLAHGSEYDTLVLAKCFFEGRKLGMFNLHSTIAA